jgi:hypothetical protein
VKRNGVAKTKRVSCINVRAFTIRTDGPGEESSSGIGIVINGLRCAHEIGWVLLGTVN